MVMEGDDRWTSRVDRGREPVGASNPAIAKLEPPRESKSNRTQTTPIVVGSLAPHPALSHEKRKPPEIEKLTTNNHDYDITLRISLSNASNTEVIDSPTFKPNNQITIPG